MAHHRFYQLDVFTRTPLAGNALAVFPDARDLRAETMQALAREMNLSETTFVTPSAGATRQVRFFTPAAEIPLAGHPTIGTWWLLAERKLIDLPENGEVAVTQETGAGILPVRITMSGGRPTRVVMTQTLPQFGESVADRAELGRALGGDGRTVPKTPAPQVVSTALPQLMVPIKSLPVLRGLPSGGTGITLAALLRTYGSDCAMCYTLETESPEATVHCRMFAPGLGVPEDPATGSAAGALGCYLVWHNIVRPHGGVARIVIEQGLEINRPSLIQVEITVGNGGEITEVRVGGDAVTVIEGEVRL
ncbi:MAG: PhzF family phenazine biosynthesis protein [Gemmatimonadetes bacterium]|nr:PhzF family phenazine biosynthesis protein [Gemmatimonadota bacterium]